jgi:aspartate/methionine/tyrosine aminotransferase
MFSSRTPEDLTPNRLAETLEAVRTRGGTILDLTDSNPTRAGFDYPSDLLRALGDPRGLVYAPSPFGLLEARTAVSADYSRRGVRIAPERIVLTASSSEAYGCLFKLLADAGDEVLIPRPSYPLFEHLAGLEQVVARPYDLDADRGWRLDFESLEAAVTPRTRAILIVSPNNPTGSYVKADEVDRLAELAAARDIAVVADEVFAEYELTRDAHAAAGRIADCSDVLSFSLAGASKSIGLPQVKVAWIAVCGPERLVDMAMARLEIICDMYLSVSTPTQLAVPELLSAGVGVRRQIARRISANYARLSDAAARSKVCRLLTTEGGWSAVLQIPSLQSEEELVLSLLQDDGVLVHPGYFFDFPRESYLVVSLLPPEAPFADAVDRVIARMNSLVVRT